MIRALLFSTVFSVSVISNAQISYTDIMPDYFQNSSGTKRFDLNNDHAQDIEFSLTILDPTSDVWFVLTTIDSLQILADPAHTNFLQQFDHGAAIPATGQWKSGSNLAIAYLTSGFPEGIWPGAADKYFAFRIKKSDGYHYGWMQMSVQNKVNNFTLKAYAYQLTADAPINAGEHLNAGVAGTIKENLFHVYNLDGIFTISCANEGFETSILNMNGVELKHVVSNDKELSMDLSALQRGVYIVYVKTAAGYSSRKIFIP